MLAKSDLNTGLRSKAAAPPPARHGRNWVWEGDGWAYTGPRADKVDKQDAKHNEKVEDAKKVIDNTMMGTASDTRDENSKEQQHIIKVKVKKFRKVKKDKTANDKATKATKKDQLANTIEK